MVTTRAQSSSQGLPTEGATSVPRAQPAIGGGWGNLAVSEQVHEVDARLPGDVQGLRPELGPMLGPILERPAVDPPGGHPEPIEAAAAPTNAEMQQQLHFLYRQVGDMSRLLNQFIDQTVAGRVGPAGVEEGRATSVQIPEGTGETKSKIPEEESFSRPPGASVADTIADVNPVPVAHFVLPFSRRVMEAPVPRKLSLPKLEQYDGSADPEDHLIHYQNCMALQNGLSDAILCRAFITSLKGPALAWFQRLPSGSIDSFEALAGKFSSRFIASKRMRHTPGYLLEVKQGKSETLREYVARFSSEVTNVESCGDDFIVAAMAKGLQSGRLADSLHKRPPATVGAMLEKAQRYISLEESKRPERDYDRKEKPDSSYKRPRPQERSVASKKEESSEFSFTDSIDKIFHDIKGKINLRPPTQMKTPLEKRDRRRFCDFHNEVGHRTDECRNLLWELEYQARNGRLKEYVQNKPQGEKVARVERQVAARPSPDGDEEPNTIFVIHAETTAGGMSKSERKRKLHELYVLYAHPPVKEPTGSQSIEFNDGDICGIQYPHDDALVVTIKIGGFTVRRVLVDNGSSANILFSDAYYKMEPIRQLQTTSSIMTDFTGDVSTPLGKLELSVAVGQGALARSVNALFYVVKASSPYNAILGRSWLHEMQAIPSTYHQCLKFPVGGEVGTLVGDHISSRECHAAALKQKA